ncbi:1-deoxy-D-xylulose-5-phosphate reductoisomerase [Alicyclobacillus sp. ALC3]|uniref:1-deoxy-D-xylulose-5-phosphate reductoisomerase n=1 Tax=Alicyclobacillus sp. ALC3 TaxID=2796143 RepID=UPI002378CC97|nr:1-deoxy-D-xylulose-5-phosphate reductoisomerase [Alicyclobacillus sp. ALC3]WDL97351.1 1-deoxy-D-xylulose-5-phosphate reductoisomerase [Alicyclobacillus sp. ALC3]
MARTLTVLGSTGVIGTNTLSVVESMSAGEWSVVALAAGKNVEKLAQQVRRHRPKFVSVADDTALSQLRALLSDLDPLPEFGVGEVGLGQAAEVESDVVVTGIVGALGLRPTWLAIARGATIALANKETLVAAGDLVMPFARSKGAQIVPVDSEHAAIFQCLQGGAASEVTRYVLTASGGPFRTWSPTDLAQASVEAALAHPNWVMGKKITVDSASLMNKGLEVIEAHHLFAAAYDKIDVVVHPQSVIHSMVEYADGSVIAQLGAPDMRVPIQYALTFPVHRKSSWPRLDFTALSQLTFESPDTARFPSLRLAFEAGRAGGYAPCVLNAANEVAVEGFLQGRMTFLGMAKLVEDVLSVCASGQPSDLDDIFAMDDWARKTAHRIMEKGGWTS